MRLPPCAGRPEVGVRSGTRRHLTRCAFAAPKVQAAGTDRRPISPIKEPGVRAGTHARLLDARRRRCGGAKEGGGDRDHLTRLRLRARRSWLCVKRSGTQAAQPFARWRHGGGPGRAAAEPVGPGGGGTRRTESGDEEEDGAGGGRQDPKRGREEDEPRIPGPRAGAGDQGAWAWPRTRRRIRACSARARPRATAR
jgi:hypothetical protein